jgi:hypothetical protein
MFFVVVVMLFVVVVMLFVVGVVVEEISEMRDLGSQQELNKAIIQFAII